MTEGNCQIVLSNKNLNREIVVSMMNRITIVIDQMATLSVMTEYVLCRGDGTPPFIIGSCVCEMYIAGALNDNSMFNVQGHCTGRSP